jgi:hypothetical protein
MKITRRYETVFVIEFDTVSEKQDFKDNIELFFGTPGKFGEDRWAYHPYYQFVSERVAELREEIWFKSSKDIALFLLSYK